MRLTVLILTCFFAVSSSGGYSVIAARPRMERPLRNVCGADVEACTHVIGVTVACTCIRANDSWQLDVRASFIPRLVMPRLTGHLLQHEMRHVSDIHDAITRYVASIASQEFASEGECERSRVAIEHSFESTVSTFAKESQKARR